MTLEFYYQKGKSYDEYTIVIDNDVYGMSENTLSPQGFNQYCCDKQELNQNAVGKSISWTDLPTDVQKAVMARMNEY